MPHSLQIGGYQPWSSLCSSTFQRDGAGGNAALGMASVQSATAVAGEAPAVAGQPLTEVEVGLMRKAMAWKVKYRVEVEGGQTKRRLHVPFLGVHKNNRGGVYPQPDVVKALGVNLIK